MFDLPLLMILVLANQTPAGLSPESVQPVAPVELQQLAPHQVETKQHDWIPPDEPTLGNGNTANPLVSLAGLADSKRPDAMQSRLLAELLAPPPGVTTTGRPLSLFEALGSNQDPSRQLEIVRAYWELVAALGLYRLHWRGNHFLEELTPKPGDEASLDATRTAAAATLAELEVALVTAQHKLTEESLWLPDSVVSPLPLPLPPVPSDQPLVGPYNTRFERVFASRPAPPRAELAQRTLPMREKAIATRAKAVVAAQTALAAARSDYLGGMCELKQVETALARWLDQQNLFLRTVRDYNDEIAEYAATVRIGPIDNATFVTMLIGPQAIPETARMAEGMVPVGTGSPWLFPTQGAPTPAPPRFVQPAAGLEPLRAPTEEAAPSAFHPRATSPTAIPDWTPSEPFGRLERAPLETRETLAPTPARRTEVPTLAQPAAPTSPTETSAPSKTPAFSDDETEAPKLPVVPVE